ncbi:MAG: ParA family protein, partial [Pseudomonadota bacterium]
QAVLAPSHTLRFASMRRIAVQFINVNLTRILIMTGNVIALTSPKGGAAKTTTALLIAFCVRKLGYRVVYIDGEPKRRLERLLGGPTLDDIGYVETAEQDRLRGAVERARETADVVIIDTEGRKSPTLALAAGLADLVLIPMAPSLLDYVDAMDVRDLVLDVSRARPDRRPAHRVVIGPVDPLGDRTLRDIEHRLLVSGCPVIPERLVRRAAFRAMVTHGISLFDLTAARVSNLDAAQQNALAFTAHVLEALLERHSQTGAARFMREAAA